MRFNWFISPEVVLLCKDLIANRKEWRQRENYAARKGATNDIALWTNNGRIDTYPMTHAFNWFERRKIRKALKRLNTLNLIDFAI